MLKLVQNQKLGLHSINADEMDINPSHQFIDELIAQIRYTHLEEVWEARLGELIEVFPAYDSFNSRKHLKIL